ncbi:T9SS type A sorting domain-containing protein [Hymenobacter gummosus]|uniref:T9SS type A sorting domain-containing protein n=1 Tax=Hymenobacter gummosus TaxID=1776032 RepID=A0A431U8Z4_9BACT|nr:S8 family serine peptidase [Hymenobacter gummosus]RTQ53332.1 T9SS type A sorting domain-containing protein [Hymenobacter gummosus]
MKTLLPLLLLLAGPSLAAQAQSADAGRLIVRLETPTAADQQAFEALNRQYAVRRVQPLNPGSPEGPAVYCLTLPAGLDAARTAEAYRRSALFRYVEADAAGQGGGVQGLTPNDTWYGFRQWSLNNNGTFNLGRATAGADIKMEDAWAQTQGDTTITVAVIDSGTKLDHPEFAGRLWRNRAEIPGNQLDDDRNGYVDDVNGYNFAYDTPNPTDDQGHGTNVIGIIGATGNNNLGFAGVNWRCKLMTCKGLNSQNNGFYSWWIAGIYYAVNNGARVINMSLGGTSTSQAMQDAVNYAVARNVVVVACMMNTNTSTPYYPAALTGLIAVGATNPDDSRARPFFWDASSGSNFGTHISLTAPGNYIYGLNHNSNTIFTTYWGGTSQATPHVAGVASLMLGRNPQLTPAQVKTILQNTADDRVGPATEDVAGWDPYFGYGRLNANRALAAVVTKARPAEVSVAEGLQAYPNPAPGAVTLRVTDARLLQRELTVTNGLGQVVARQRLQTATQLLPLRLAPGVYWLTVAGAAGGQALRVE